MRLWLLLGLCLGSQAASIQVDPGCPTGFTGDNCINPTCASPSNDVFVHDGMVDPGDTIAHFDSDTCTETFQFALDNFVVNVLYITVTQDQDRNFPTPTLFDPAGNQKPQAGEHFPSTKQGSYYWSLNGTVKGFYTLKVSSQKETTCEIIVSGQTSLTVDGGFITDMRDDNVQTFDTMEHQGIAQYPRMGSSSYLAFKVQNENYPTLAQSVRIFQEGDAGTKYGVIARYNCAFPHITSTPFNCTQQGTWHAEFSGIDNSGNTWTRLYEFTCEASSVTVLPPTGTPPVIQPADQCYNDGILTPNRTCYCGEFYDGAYCEWKLCMNGGTLNIRTDQCICAKGWTGDYCEHVRCSSRSDDNFYRQKKAIGFVVRSAQSMQAQIAQIATAAETISNNTNNIQFYILSVVQNGNVYFTNVYEDPISFKNGILGITHPPVDTVCSDALILGVTSIMEKVEFQMFPNSPIFIFSDGVTNDGYATAGYALQQMSTYRPILYFMLADSANGQCNIDISSEGYQTLLNFAAFSQGLAIKSDITKIAQTTNMLVTTVFNTNVLLQNDLLDCRQAPTYQPFFVDESITDVWIYSIGENLTLTVTYPDLSTRSLIPYFFTGNLHIWLLSNAKTGTYMVNFKTGTNLASECSYRVTAQSIYTLFFGASTDMLTDKYTIEPVMNAESHIVAKINNVYMPDPIDISAEITFWVNDINSGRIVLYSSSGLWRDGCAYNLYFGSYQCTVPGLGFYASVYMTDNAGWTVLRTITGYCSANLPPAPGEHCQNGGASMSNGTCVCPSHFSGDNCQTIHCENAGTPQFGVCSCPPYYTGQFCEVTACNQQNAIINYNPDFRSLTFLMHDTITMRSVFRTVNDVIPRVIHDIVSQHPKWIENYQLIRFNDTYSESLSDSKIPQDFINAINRAYNANMNNSDYSCAGLDLYRTILNALKDEKVYYNGILYVFVFGMPRADSDSYDQIITHIMGSGIQINVVQFSMNPCGQDYTTDGLMALAQASGGIYYLSSGPNAGNVVSSLPTLHSSGIMYERFVDNCADKTFYIPVDANTQSISAYIQGEMIHDPIYTKPDQTVANYLSVNNVWSDIGMDSRMDQIIQACDPGWTLSDGHCFYFAGDVSTWEDARDKCLSFGGNLATVYSAAEQKWLNYSGYNSKFWIGLNDIANYNQWVWQGTNLTLTSTHYTNWANGQPNGNETQRCVLDDNMTPSGGWIATDCSEKHYFACSKDTYNSVFEPGDNVARNYIQRGTWAIRVQADGPCSILLRAQSTLQVVPLYTTDVHSDYGGTEPIANVSANRMIAHVTGLAEGSTHNLEYGHVYSDNGQLLQTNTLIPRDSNTCNYNYISTAWQCVNNGFQMMMTGVDSFGYSFQRVLPVLCLTAPDPNSCENGGVFTTVGHKGFCTCPPEFYGARCEFVFCGEHGYPSASLGKCDCYNPKEYTGQFCNIPVCNRGGVNNPDLSTDQRTFVLAIDGSSTDDMAPVLADIKNTLTTLLAGLSNTYKYWFGNYVAVIFRDSGVSGKLNVFSSTIVDTNYTAFANKIDAELKANPYQSKQKSRAVFGGLAQALQSSTIKQNSFAFVLTNSKAEDIRNEAMVLSATAQNHTQINFMFIGDSTAPGGGNDYTDPAVSDMYEAAHNSGGSAYQIGTGQVLSTVWQMIAGTYYKSYTIVSHHVQNCGQYTDYIQLGSNSTELMIDVAQGDPKVAVTNADGANVNPTPIFSSKNNLLTEFHQTGDLPGIWSVTMTGSTNTCMFNIRAKSDIEVFAAFTQDTEKDGGYHDGSSVPFPMGNGLSNAVVAITNGGSLSYVQMLDIEEHGILWASPLIKRSMCAYNYISQSTFICDRPSFLMAVDGFDVIGHPFRQLLTYHCQGYIPPTTPSKPTTSPKPTTPPVTLYPPTDLSKAKFDMIFVADSSDSFTDMEYQQVLVPIRTAFQNMKFGDSRLLLASYDQTTDFYGSNFNSIVDVDTFAIKWIDVMLTGYTGKVGNNIDDVLNYIVNTTIPATPFRDGVRKVVVFISSLGWDRSGFDEEGYKDPADNIARLKAMKVEFIPIAFGGQANLFQLNQFSPNCLQEAHNADDFNTIAQYLVYNIAQTTAQCT